MDDFSPVDLGSGIHSAIRWAEPNEVKVKTIVLCKNEFTFSL